MLSRRLLLPILTALVVSAGVRAEAATIGLFNYDLFAGPEFSILNTSDSAGTGGVDLTGTLSDVTLTLYSGGAVDSSGAFSFASEIASLTFSTIDSSGSLTPLIAPLGFTTLACTDSPTCGTGYDALPAFDSAVLTAAFSLPGTLSIAPLLGLTVASDDPFYSPFVAIEFTPAETPVPEPGTLVLVAIGCAACLRRRRLRTPE